jgi:hypothetical protein
VQIINQQQLTLRFQEWIRDNLIWNQLILEFYKEGEPSSGWVHCSYSTDLNKKESLIAYREDGKTQYKPWR